MGLCLETNPRAAVERAMKVQEVILRAMAKKIAWLQAAGGPYCADERSSDATVAVAL
jgi:hypothetical protein